MKIWVQSTSALDKDPLWAPYAQVLRKHVQDTAKPGTTTDVHGVEVMSPAKSWLSYAELLINLTTSPIFVPGLKSSLTPISFSLWTSS